MEAGKRGVFIIWIGVSLCASSWGFSPACLQILQGALRLKLELPVVESWVTSPNFNLTINVGVPQQLSVPTPEHAVSYNRDRLAEKFDALVANIIKRFDPEIAAKLSRVLIGEVYFDPEEADAQVTMAVISQEARLPVITLHPHIAKTKLFKRLLILRAILEQGFSEQMFKTMSAESIIAFESHLNQLDRVGRFSRPAIDEARRAKTLSLLAPVAMQKILVQNLALGFWVKDIEENVENAASREICLKWIHQMHDAEFYQVATKTCHPDHAWELCPEESDLLWAWIMLIKNGELRLPAEERHPHCNLAS